MHDSLARLYPTPRTVETLPGVYPLGRILRAAVPEDWRAPWLTTCSYHRTPDLWRDR